MRTRYFTTYLIESTGEYDGALRTQDIRVLLVWESDGKGGNTLVPPELQVFPLDYCPTPLR